MTQLPMTGFDPPPAPLGLLPLRETPAYRVANQSTACTLTEVLATLIGGARATVTAEKLVAHYGTAAALARADVVELAGFHGIGQKTATRLKAALELGARLMQPVSRVVIRSAEDAAEVLRGKFVGALQEYFYVLVLDTRSHVIGEPIELYHGSLNTALLRTGEVFRDAIKRNAAAIIVAHNHPSGDPSPSPEDVAVTRTLIETGKLLDIDVLDHLVFGQGHVVSLKERGLAFAK